MTIKPVKIVTPVGMMGYGYEVDKLYKGIQLGASAIIIDAGSTDSGPQKLALGEGTCPHEAHVRDFGNVLDAVFHHKVKLIISSAGGDGSNSHVDEFVGIVQDYCVEKGYSLKLAKIYASVPKSVVHKALKQGVITPCGAVPELTATEIDLAVEIVAQMGQEPFMDVMAKVPDFDIIIAGRAYDPSPYAAYAIANGVTNWGTAYHMGKVMECGAQCSWPKSKEALATIWDDRFDILPLQSTSKCSPQSLAAHSLYENPRTDLHAGPGGVLDLTTSSYQQTGERSAGASGAGFHVSNPYTVKLEGAKVLGFRSIWLGSFRDPVLISQIDDFQKRLKEFLHIKFANEKFDIALKAYGKDGTMGPLEVDTSVGKEIFLLGEIQAENQILATQIANSGRVFCVHAPYEGQISTTGNYAMPVTPLEIPLGPVSCFNIYHLLPVEDPLALFPWFVMQVGLESSTAIRNPSFGFDLIKPDPKVPATNCHNDIAAKKVILQRGKTPVTSIAKDIRSKNAGPYEITFDIIFNDLDAWNFAKESPKLTPEALAPLWHANVKDVIACQFSEPARAFKFTLPRPWKAGAFGERDMHCSQQHVPLLNLVL
ncbi:uncharacterized protein PAC_03406 [Phialocephala subalpina]|uniref:DUF1446 domain protein n=1 Tax=Phialocephala subalpina TaxID=576137 RepID=A0A1L7WL81_9HELO|nr:uncharacterized protein PAC_03406 [Phialocephala subalpina]